MSASLQDSFDHDLYSDYGLVAPDGTFYSCDFGGHSRLARELGALDLPKYLLSPGWIHVADNEWEMDQPCEVTQSQITTLFDWCAVATWRNQKNILRKLERSSS